MPLLWSRKVKTNQITTVSEPTIQSISKSASFFYFRGFARRIYPSAKLTNDSSPAVQHPCQNLSPQRQGREMATRAPKWLGIKVPPQLLRAFSARELD